MFNFFILFLIGISFHNSYAEIKNTNYHITNQWYDTYPEGYLIEKDLSIPLYKAADNLVEIGDCYLNKGRTFNYMSHLNKDDTFAILTGVNTYMTTKTVTTYKEDGSYNYEEDNSFSYPKGSIVYELTYLNEGGCFIQYNGEIFQSDCPHFLIDGFKLINPSPMQTRRMIKTTCDNNKTGWILESDLIEGTKPNYDGVTSVKILTEDEFIERGWIVFEEEPYDDEDN